MTNEHLATSQPVRPELPIHVVGGGSGPCQVVGEASGKGGSEVFSGDDEGHEDTGEVVESQEEEVDPQRTLSTPYQPTQSEIEEHRVGHLPYRCRWREVQGRRRDDA